MRWTALVLIVAALSFSAGSQLGSREFAGNAGERARAALAEPDPMVRAAALVELLGELPEAQLEEVVVAYESAMPTGPGPTEIQLLCEVWSGVDPVRALDRISTWPKVQRSQGVTALLRAWGRLNGRAAYEFARGIRDDGTAQHAVFSGWAESGGSALWDFVASMTPGMDRETASIAAMQAQVAREGFDAMLRRVESLPDNAPGQFKLAAIRTATGLVADHEPARALAFADRLAGGPFDKGLLRRIGVRGVRRDAPGTLQMLLDRPAGVERDWAIKAALRTWLRLDREAAMAWMPEAAAADPRFAPLVDIHGVALANEDAARRQESIRRAIRWVERSPDEGVKEAALTKIGAFWLHHEPAAAGEWLAARGLSDAARAELERRQRLQEGASGRGRTPPNAGAAPTRD